VRRAVFLFLVLVLSIAGVVVSAYLVRDHLAVYSGGVAEGLLCGAAGRADLAGGRFDCGQVAAHESSWLLGWPVAVWGLGYFIVVTALAVLAIILRGPDRKAVCAWGAILCTLGFFFDLYLGFIMVMHIGSICLNCVATYAINLLLAILFWRLGRGLKVPLSLSRLFPSVRALIRGDDAAYYCGVTKSGVLALTALAVSVSWYRVHGDLSQIREWGEKETDRFLAKLGTPPDVDMARFAGQPTVGPADARLSVVLAGDFQCNFCRSLANHVERLRKAAPDRIRLVFVNSPISSLCNSAIGDVGHVDACWLAEVGECAAAQGKFWDYHDLLYKNIPHAQVSKTNVERRFSEIGLDADRFRVCMESGVGKAAVTADIALCGELGLTATPSIVINGYLKRGSFFPWMLDRVIRTMLRNP
jgi:uncharacterized membrane protein/predicted DsbA family dithiol-disulfide isomerase